MKEKNAEYLKTLKEKIVLLSMGVISKLSKVISELPDKKEFEEIARLDREGRFEEAVKKFKSSIEEFKKAMEEPKKDN